MFYIPLLSGDGVTPNLQACMSAMFPLLIVQKL